MSERINGYCLTTPFTMQNAGMCEWAFAEKDGKEYFIKRFLDVKYPSPSSAYMFSPETVSLMQKEAEAFYRQKKTLYDRLALCRTGNILVVEDFFLSDSAYYAVTERVFGPYLSIEEISRMSLERKLVLFQAASYSLSCLHAQGIVHADLKPNNILVRQTSRGFFTAKLIDFDLSFLEEDVPEEIGGDQAYISPEAVRRMKDPTVEVTTKADIFALGVLFHLYSCGDPPGFDRERFHYISTAVEQGAALTLNDNIPSWLRSLIRAMLDREPAQRPTADAVLRALKGESWGFWFIPATDDDL